MRVRGSRWAFLLTLATGAVALVSLPAAAAPAPAPDPPVVRISDATACHATGWRKVKLPGADRAIGMDLAAAGGRVRWVVGMSAGASRPRQPWIVHRTSSGWKRVSAPRVGTDAGLVAVSAGSKSKAWAVGFRVRSRDLQPVAMRWNGSRWRDSSPPGGSKTRTLTDVTSGAQTWAVGYRTTQKGPRPYAVKRSGSRWVRHDVPLTSDHFGGLTAVGGNGKTGIWAAGWQSDRRGISTLLAQWRGGRWRATGLPGGDEADTVLTGLTAVGSVLWAVGFHDDGLRQVPRLWKREGGTWRAVAATAPDGSMLADDLVISGGRGVIAGGSRAPGRSSMGHAVATLRGEALDLTRRPAGIRKASYLRAIERDGKRDLLAVGWTDGRAVLVRTCRGISSTAETSPISGRLLAPDLTATPATEQVAPAVAVRFRDVARKAGLDITTPTYGATVLDIDGNGWDDLLISRHRSPAMVLLNRRGTFKPAPSHPLARKDRHGCTGGDVDGDGKDEAYCAIGAARGVKFKSNELVVDLLASNPGNQVGAWGAVELFGRGRRAALTRLDDDGQLDLVVTADPLRVDGLPALNRAYRNVDGGSFEAAMSLGLDLPLGGDCALSGQLDGQGQRELVLCTDEPWAGRRNGVHIFRYRNGRYVDATGAFGVRPDGAIDAAVADFDGDGRADLAQLSPTRLVISLQRGGRLKRVASLPMSAAQAIAAGDVNRDRRADLYVVRRGSGNASDRLLVNLGNGRRFRAAAIPQARSGAGDDVVAIDHDRNGLTDFLVLNGYPRSGPIQLIAAFPR